MPHPDGDDVPALRAEIVRLSSIVGHEELSYTELKLELWRVRDELIGMEAELGNARGRALVLQREIDLCNRPAASVESAPAASSDGLAAALRKKATSLREQRL